MATVAAYAPVLSGSLAGDDFCHLLDALDLPLSQFVAQTWGGHVLLTTNAVTWPLFRLFGLQPSIYATIALSLHLLNVALLQRLVVRWTGRPVLACVAAAIWGSSPLHDVTLRWFATFGVVLLSTCVLALLLSLDVARARGHARTVEVVAWVVLALMASTSFGMGVAAGLLLPALARLLGPPSLGVGAWASLAATPVAALGIYVLVSEWGTRGAVGSFDTSVALHGALVAWRFAATLLASLPAYAASVLFAGAQGAPPGEPAAWRVAVGLAGPLILAMGLARMDTLARRRFLAAALLGLTAYGIVVAGRASVFAQTHFSPGEVAAMARHYHTFPSLTLVLCACLAWRALIVQRTPLATWATGAAVVWLVVSAIGIAGRPRVGDHGNAEVRGNLDRAIARLDAAIRTAPPGLVVIGNEQVGLGTACYTFGLAGIFLMAYDGRAVVDGRTVRFRVPPDVWHMAHARGGRMVPLLILARRGPRTKTSATRTAPAGTATRPP